MSDPERDVISELRSDITKLIDKISHLEVELVRHTADTALERTVNALSTDVYGRGGIKDQVTGFKAVAGFIGAGCGIAGALIAKLWK